MLAELDLVLPALPAAAAVVADTLPPALTLFNPKLTSQAGRSAGACILPMLPQLA